MNTFPHSSTRPSRRRRAVAMGIAAAAVALGSVAVDHSPAQAAAGVPYAPSSFGLTSTAGPPGTHLTAHGTCHGGAVVPYHFVAADGSGPGAVAPSVGDVVAGPAGTWSVQLEILPTAHAGQHFTFGAYCIDGHVDPITQPTLSKVTFAVTSPVAPAPQPDQFVVVQPSFTG